MKRAAGRTGSSHTPAHIRVVGVELDEDDRAYMRRKLGMKLSKFATAIERISVRITDVNGPRGGVDQRCRIKVVLSGSPSVMVERQHAVAQAAFDIALRAAEYALQRTLGRRRMKPLRRGESGRASGLSVVPRAGAREPASAELTQVKHG